MDHRSLADSGQPSPTYILVSLTAEVAAPMAASERDATRAGTSEAPDQAHALPRAESGQILARGAEAAGWSRDDGRGYGPTGPLPRGVSPVCVLPGHTAAITLLRWGPDGQILASAGA